MTLVAPRRRTHRTNRQLHLRVGAEGKPLGMSDAHVRAILAGRKTLTQRPGSPDEAAPWARGDRLWVTEAWRPALVGTGYVYRADGWCPGPWRPALFMPAVASRITLGVLSVTLRRLHEIPTADLYALGAPASYGPSRALRWYHEEWDGFRGGRRKDLLWRANPHVWRIEFEVLRPASAVALRQSDSPDSAVLTAGTPESPLPGLPVSPPTTAQP